MGTRRQQIKLPTDLVKELQTIKDLRHRHNWRKQFKNDYAVMELWEDRIREANEPIWATKIIKLVVAIPHHSTIITLST